MIFFTATFTLPTTKRTVIKTILVEARTPLAAGGFYSLRVHCLLLDYHIALPHLAHYHRRLLTICVLLKSTILMNAGLARRSLNAVNALFMPVHIIIMLEINRSDNRTAANATDMKIC
jgi:hypothetical protein